jgi:hypothetical protein
MINGGQAPGHGGTVTGTLIFGGPGRINPGPGKWAAARCSIGGGRRRWTPGAAATSAQTPSSGPRSGIRRPETRHKLGDDLSRQHAPHPPGRTRQSRGPGSTRAGFYCLTGTAGGSPRRTVNTVQLSARLFDASSWPVGSSSHWFLSFMARSRCHVPSMCP